VAREARPRETIDKLNRTINEIQQSKEFMAKSGAPVVVRRGGTSADLTWHIKAEYDRPAPVITDPGLAKTM